MFERSRVVLVETSICRSRGSARGQKGTCESGPRWSSRSSRTSMNTCGSRARRPTGAARRAGPERAPDQAFPGGRRLDFVEAGRIDVRRWKRSQRWQSETLRRFALSLERRRQRVRAARRQAAEKAPAPSPAARERERGSLLSRSRRRAVKHGAVGGRMTARWSGVYREQRQRRTDRGGSRSGTPAGFPTALGGQPPKSVFLRRVLVSESRL